MEIKDLIGKKVNNLLWISLQMDYPGIKDKKFHEIQDAKLYEEDDSIAMVKLSPDSIMELVNTDEWFGDNGNILDEEHLWVPFELDSLELLNFPKEEESDGTFEMLGENVDFQSATVPKAAMAHLIEFVKELRKDEALKEMYDVELMKIQFDEDQELTVKEIMSYERSMDLNND